MSTDSKRSQFSELPHDENILLEAHEGTLLVTLNRPASANALNEPLMLALRTLWQAVARQGWVRAIVVTGAGKAFCAGADVAMLGAPRTHIGNDAADELSFLPGPIVSVPVIVAVNGVCAGGGLHFVSDSDICIASHSSRFLDPHVSVGQVSALEPLELLLRGRRDQVIRMALLGKSEVLNADAAHAAGLVSEVLTADELMPRALELGARIAEGSPEAIRVTRKAIRDFEAELLKPHLDRGWQAIQEHWEHPDSLEGPRAFQEKRPAVWASPSLESL